jgi:hypothetical protein
MTYHDDPDLERRLHRITEGPEPPVPGSVFRYVEEVTSRKRGFQMRLFSIPRPRPGLVVGLASAAAVLSLAAGFSFALRYAQTGGATAEPSASASASASATPSESPTVSGSPGATMNAAGFTTPGAVSDWTGFSWSGQPAPSPMLADDELFGSGVGQVLHWKGGYVATGSITAGGETRPSRGLWTSPDGESWSAVTSIDAPAVLVSVAPGGLLAIGTPPFAEAASTPLSAWFSSDGSSWRNVGTPNLPGALLSIAGTDRAVVATVVVETGTLKSTETSYQVFYSTDGVSWTALQVSPGLSAAQLAYGLPPHVQTNDGRFYLMGSGVVGDEPIDEMWLSEDGQTWTRSKGGYQLFADYIDFGRDGMVLHTSAIAAPSANLQAYSTDGGLTWHDDPAFGPLGEDQREGPWGTRPNGVIASNGTVLVAVEIGGQQAWLSYDGRTWSAIDWAGGDPEGPIQGGGASYGGYGFTVLPRGVLLLGVYGAAT